MQSEAPFKRDNHYVPQFLPRNSARVNGAAEVMEYRLLVGHENIPKWQARSVNIIAKHTDLYTVASDLSDSDAPESWLDSEFEAPAVASVNRVLAHLFAAQFMRTPAYYLKRKLLWAHQMEEQRRCIGERLRRQQP